MPDPNKQRTEADAVAEVAREYFKPELLEIQTRDGVVKCDVLLRPDGQGGYSIESLKRLLDEHRTNPEYRSGRASLTDLDSLINHVQRFSDEDSILFASNQGNPWHIQCVLDYHCAGATGDPRFGRHRAQYEFPLSDEWTAWNEINGSPLEQISFAEFLEDRILDVIAPPVYLTDEAKTGAKLTDAEKRLLNMVVQIGGKVCGPVKLMELAKGLKIHDNQVAKQMVNLSSGEAQIQFESEHRDGDNKPIKVPNLFLIAIPVFKNGPAYQIPVRLRYRLRAGSISWSMEMYQPDRAADHAFTEACERAATETGLPLLYGKPEGTP